MITIESLVEQGANVKLEITPSDLKMFAESIVQRTIMAQQEEQKIVMQREAEEVYFNTKQVRELLNVCEGTLNLWGEARLPRACQGRQQEHVCQVRCTPRADRGKVRKCNVLL